MCMPLFRLFVKSDVLSVVTTVHTFQNKNEKVYITQKKKTQNVKWLWIYKPPNKDQTRNVELIL